MRPRREPVRILAFIAGTIQLCLPHLAAFGIPITPEQQAALEAVVPALVTLYAAEIARGYVWSEASVDRLTRTPEPE